MKIKQIFFILLIGLLLTLTCVSASQADNNSTFEAAQDNLTLKSYSLKDVITDAEENDTIYLENITYSGKDNNQIIIDKSISLVGSENTIIDGENEKSIFIITDNVKVSFKNIKFINASKTGKGNDIYGGALEIHNSEVTIDNCQFISNSINYGQSKNIYGAAISNEGNLFISNSYFLENFLNSAYTHEGFGGAIYNNGRLYVNNTSFIRSRGGEYSKGSVLYNNNFALINNSVIAGTYSLEESMGSAIFNNGDLTLLNSIVENNTIERNNFNYIYGNIFNSGLLIAYGNIFKNNTAYYKQPNAGYEGCPTIYNVGDLNLSYNAFIDNIGGFKKIYRDVYLNGGQSVYIDDNWWGSNDNPFTTQAINIDKVNRWLILDVAPVYSMVNINQSVNISALWRLSNGSNPKFLIPLDIVISDEFNQYKKYSLTNGECVFTFNNTQNRGLYTVEVSLYSFKQSVSIDVGKIKTNIVFSLNKDVLYSNEMLIAKVKLYDENSNLIGGKISLSIADQKKIINLDNGEESAVFIKLIPDTYELKMEYCGNDSYFKSYALANITVKKYPVNLNVEEIGDVYVDEIFSINVNLATEEVEGAANLYINGIFRQVVYLKYGDTIISFSNFDEGTYNLTVEVSGNEYYQKTNASVNFDVLKYNPNLNITSQDIFISDNETLKILTSDYFEGEVILSINGVNSTLFLNNKITNIEISSLTAGEYDVDLVFKGNAKFNPQNASTSFKVMKYSTSLIVDITDNMINVKALPVNCSGIMRVYVNRKYYQLNMVNGEANFNVEFDEGTNYIYVIYEGNEYYCRSDYNTTVGSGEAIAIIGVNLTSWEYNDFNYTVQIFEKNGFAMINKVISITVDSQSYDVITNSQGFAILPLNLKEGYYEVISTYKNLTARNYLTINPVVFNLTVNNISYGEKAIVIGEFNETVRGKVNFTLSNGLTSVTDIIDGKATYTIENLTVGLWEVSAFYTNDLFSKEAIKTAFEVEKLNSIIILDIEEAFVGQNETITAISNNLTGNITFTVDGESYTVDITDSTVVLVLSDLGGGNHTLEVRYAGDDYHKNTSLKLVFYIKTLKTDINLSINETPYGEDIIIDANVDENASGLIKFTLNNITKISQIADGMANTTFRGFNVGSYTIHADYLGDNQFLSSSASFKFNVVKAKSAIELYVNDVVLDENIRIYARVSPNATGKVSFRMTDYYSPRDKNIINSTASWLIAPLEYGQYEVIATYLGDANYYSSATRFILNVTQTRSILTVEANDVSNQDRAVVKVTLVSWNGKNIDGIVNVQLDSKNYKIHVQNGKGTLNLGKLTPANYRGVAIYDGDDSYSSSKANFEFTVSDSLLKSILSCENVTTYYNSDVNFVITLTNAKDKALSQETVYVVIDGAETTYVTDKDGKVYLTINNTLGKYDVNVRFNGSNSYYPSNATASIEVLSTIESDDVVKEYGTGAQYFALFRDSNGKVLSNVDVVFNIAGKNYRYTTLPNGIVRLNINLSPGIYYITAINPVTNETKVSRINILKGNDDVEQINGLGGIRDNANVVNYFGATSTYKVRVHGNDGKPLDEGNTVVFTVNGKKYNVKTDTDGFAKISVKLKPKQYIVTAEFDGSKVYNIITVKPVLTLKIISTKKSKKTKFKARILNSKGIPLKGKKITFKIKGKKYRVKTNKNGVATLKIKLTFKKGTYKVYAMYSKSKVKKIIKVR